MRILINQLKFFLTASMEPKSESKVNMPEKQLKHCSVGTDSVGTVISLSVKNKYEAYENVLQKLYSQDSPPETEKATL